MSKPLKEEDFKEIEQLLPDNYSAIFTGENSDRNNIVLNNIISYIKDTTIEALRLYDQKSHEDD